MGKQGGNTKSARDDCSRDERRAQGSAESVKQHGGREGGGGEEPSK